MKELKQNRQGNTRLNFKAINIIFGVLLAAGLISVSVYSALSISDKDNCAPSPSTPSSSTQTSSTQTSSTPSSSTPSSSLSSTGAASSNGKSAFMRDLNECGLNHIKLWKTLIVIMSAGAAGGLVFELLNLKGNIEWPHWPSNDELATKFAYATSENLFDLGYLARLFIGALSAPVTIAVIGSNSVFAMLATSVVAGSSGALVFRALQDRVVAGIYLSKINEQQTAAETQTQNLKLNAELIGRRLDEAIEAFGKLKGKILTHGECSLGKLTCPTDPDKKLRLAPDNFIKVWIPLNKAKEAAEDIEAQTDASWRLRDVVDEAIGAFAKLRDAVDKVAESPSGESEFTLRQGETIELEYFYQVDKFLNEAKERTERIVSPDNSSTN